jgi:hypothetical protein
MTEFKITEEFKIKTVSFRKVLRNDKECLEVSKDKLNWHPCFEKIYAEAEKHFLAQENKKEKKAKVGN